MKRKIFVDTDVLLDVLLEREGFYYDALKIWGGSELGEVDAYISSTAIGNVYSVLRKLKSDTTALIAVRIITRIFKVVPVDGDIIALAMDMHDKDFESDIALQCAIKAKCPQIFTRSPNNYDHSAIAVVPPSAFVP